MNQNGKITKKHLKDIEEKLKNNSQEQFKKDWRIELFTQSDSDKLRPKCLCNVAEVFQ